MRQEKEGIVKQNYKRIEPTHDYLKYYRVVRGWAKAKYGLGTADLEMLYFLYSEQVFKKEDFLEYSQMMSWDKNRFQRLAQEGWIQTWREGRRGKAALYDLSYKGKKVVITIYKKLNGEEIGESHIGNPLFKTDVTYMRKVYRNAVKKMNEFIKQRRRRAQ